MCTLKPRLGPPKSFGIFEGKNLLKVEIFSLQCLNNGLKPGQVRKKSLSAD